ncbi:macro domain-containing protein [Butyrivibrio sp. AE3004]|uniref:macro domain-containing protein n=1 Tax=Butyrivibrio sp. AE3004 TaxID=1506994 RepID=UPI0004940CAE|nr:macro domain-containing protein [Butyrivibrio sp. AE3004]
MPFQIIRNDITKVEADAIVNTANPKVTIGDGVDYAIYEAAGREKLLAEREKIGALEPGEVGVTPAFDLNAKYIIHVSSPRWVGGDEGEAELLRKCYDESLYIAYEKGCRSIAYPLLATGTYQFPKDLGIKIATDAFKAFLEDHEMEITLVVFGKETFRISGELFDDVCSFINQRYVENAEHDEYTRDWNVQAQRLSLEDEDEDYSCEESYEEEDEECEIPEDFDYSCEADFDVEYPDSEDTLSEDFEDEEPSPKEYGNPKTSAGIDSIRKIRGIFKKSKETGAAKTSAPAAAESARMFTGAAVPPKSLEETLKGIYKESFGEHLQRLINKKGLKASEVYAAANMSKQYFSKLLNDKVKPSKEKMLALAVGLRLNMDETVDFLRLAGYAMSPISQTDAVVEYFIRKQEYNVMQIDVVLYEYGLDPISKYS